MAKATAKSRTLKAFRFTHRYIGAFTAPALLFFALSGALQTFNLHDTKKGSGYKPPAWIVTLNRIHKDQTAEPKPKAADKPKALETQAKANATPAAAADPPAPHHATWRQLGGAPGVGGHPAPASKARPPSDQRKRPEKKVASHLPLKIFFLLVAVGLFSSTLTGVYMSYKFERNKAMITALLVLGIALPIAMLIWF